MSKTKKRKCLRRLNHFNSKIFRKLLSIIIVLFFNIEAYSEINVGKIQSQIEDIRNEFNNLSQPSSNEARLFDNTLKELDTSIDYIMQNVAIGNIDEATSAINFVEKSFLEISKTLPSENKTDTSKINFENIDKNDLNKIKSISVNIKRKNEVIGERLIDDMIFLNKNGIDPFIVNRNLKDSGISVVKFQQISKFLRNNNINLSRNAEIAYWQTISANNLGFDKKEIQKDITSTLNGGFDEKLYLTEKTMRTLGYSEKEIETELKALNDIEKGILDPEIHYTTQSMKNLGYSSEDIKNELDAINKIKEGKLDEEVYYLSKSMKNLGYSQEQINNELLNIKDIQSGKLDEEIYYISKSMKNLGYSDEEIKQEILSIKEINNGNISEIAYYTAKSMKSLGASAEEIASELKALEAIDAGELSEEIHYTVKSMENLGYTAEEIQKEVAALEAIDAGELSEEIHYTVKSMENLGYTAEEIQKEVAALEAIDAGELNEVHYEISKSMSNLGYSQDEINAEMEALQKIEKGEMTELEYYEQKSRKALGLD